MSSQEVETVSTGADKAKLAVAAVLVVGAIVAFYALGKQGALAQWAALLNPVLLGVVCLVCVAMVWSRAYPGLVHYPVSPLEPSPPSLNWGGWQ